LFGTQAHIAKDMRAAVVLMNVLNFQHVQRPK
jgi:diacylglycerol kinase